MTPDLEKARQLNVTVGVDFVDAVPELGIKAVNGVPTKVNIRLINYEEGNVRVELIGGSLWSAEKGVALKNLTALKVGMNVGKDQQVCHLRFLESRYRAWLTSYECRLNCPTSSPPRCIPRMSS